MSEERFVPPADLKQELRDLMGKYQTLLYLHSWDITVRYMDGDHQDDDHVAIETRVQDEYMQCTWSVYPHYFTRLSKEEREECIIHELCHCITAPPYEMIRAILDGEMISKNQLRKCGERITTHIQRIVSGIIYQARKPLDK